MNINSNDVGAQNYIVPLIGLKHGVTYYVRHRESFVQTYIPAPYSTFNRVWLASEVRRGSIGVIFSAFSMAKLARLRARILGSVNRCPLGNYTNA